jgi:ABC-type polysaccharide/polyol phosphate transport system ATPase subunit
MSTILRVKNVSKRFVVKLTRSRSLRESIIRKVKRQQEADRIIWALRDINFELRRGQTLGIIGHNGAGKSTLLRLICDIGSPTKGTVWHEGTISGLLQLASFHPMLTGRENIRTAGMLSGLTRKQLDQLEDKMIAFAELEEVIDHPVRTYSDGMVLRLSFSAAVHMDPDILVIDEILTIGDIRFKERCRDRMMQFRDANKTLILTSHDMGQIRMFCDDVLVLEEGKLVFRADAENAIKHYEELMRRRTERRVQQASNSAAFVLSQPDHGSRMGTYEAEIINIRFCDEQGVDLQNFTLGSGIVIEIEFQTKKKLSGLALTLGIFTDDDVKCFESSVPSLESIIGMTNGTGRVRCRIPTLPLLPGNYYVNVGLYPSDWKFIYDYHWQMHPLQIVGNSTNLSGILSVAPEWTA